MSARFRQLTVDCQDPARMVAFWTEAMDYERMPAPAGFATWREWYLSVGVPESELADGDCCDRIQDPAGEGPLIWFQPVPEAKSTKNRLHFDLQVTLGREEPEEIRRATLEAETARLVGLGARVFRGMPEATGGHVAVVLQDPEGNEFCLV